MKKQTFLLLFIFSGLFSTTSAQVGVYIIATASTLDVTAKNAIGSVATGSQSAAAANIHTVGYHYFSGGLWVKLMIPAPADIYNSNDTLTGNRIVTQGTNTLVFRSNAPNGFPVDGSNFSVDELNNRVVGITTNT